MVKYYELLEELESISEVDFADFQRRIIRDGELKILGVRTPQLRKLAKKYSGKYELFTQFPNEYYEVVFLKLTLAAQLPYDDFVAVLDDCVRLITDWALCDLFTPQCIKKAQGRLYPIHKKIPCCRRWVLQRRRVCAQVFAEDLALVLRGGKVSAVHI